MQSSSGSSGGFSGDSGSDLDEYFVQAGNIIIEKEKASIGMLQRAFKIGFNRAARIMDQLCEAGVVGDEEGTKPRKVLMTKAQFDALKGMGVKYIQGYYFDQPLRRAAFEEKYVYK